MGKTPKSHTSISNYRKEKVKRTNKMPNSATNLQSDEIDLKPIARSSLRFKKKGKYNVTPTSAATQSLPKRFF